MTLRAPKSMLFAAVAAMSLAVSAPASAEIRQVDGTLWKASTVEQKQAYLVGVSNLLTVNQAYQVKKGMVDANAPLTRYLASTDAHSIPAIQEKIDSWYASNPDKLGTPVLGVIWLGYVSAK